MRCPNCNHDLRGLMRRLGAKGGKASRRTLSPEQAKKMVAARERKRKLSR